MLRLLKEVAVVGRGVVEPEAVEQWGGDKDKGGACVCKPLGS